MLVELVDPKLASLELVVPRAMPHALVAHHAPWAHVALELSPIFLHNYRGCP